MKRLKRFLVLLFLAYGRAGANLASHHGGYEPAVPTCLHPQHKIE